VAELTISEVARQAGLRPSAIRYYERIRILPAARRVSGQRRYEMSAVYRLVVVRKAQEAGFTLDEIRRLFFGFGNRATASGRWQQLAALKIAELDSKMEELQRMKILLERLRTRCQCDTLEQCGAAIVRAAS
jgi:MerR family redox-sensitive transcriptional activator SoxR